MSAEWKNELTVFTRAFAGAAVFGIPLVFTMEMWWIGKSLSLPYLLVSLALAFVANFGLAYVAGFRTNHSLGMSVDQTIDALAVGVVSAFVLLVTINQLQLAEGIGHGTGMVMLLAVPFSLGASVAKQVFSSRDGRQGEETSHLTHTQGILADVGATAIGGVFIGISIAPTDEVTVVAAGITWWHLMAIIGLSLFLSYLIVFASGFDEASPPGPFQHPITETLLCYLVSVGIALGMLLMFGRITPNDPLQEIIRQTAVLALPATIGGAGGRLVI